MTTVRLVFWLLVLIQWLDLVWGVLQTQQKVLFQHLRLWNWRWQRWIEASLPWQQAIQNLQPLQMRANLTTKTCSSIDRLIRTSWISNYLKTLIYNKVASNRLGILVYLMEAVGLPCSFHKHRSCLWSLLGIDHHQILGSPCSRAIRNTPEIEASKPLILKIIKK